MSKVGRNDPCPCGSGKKYKQCCWQKRLPLSKRSFKATVLKSGLTPPKQGVDLMERTFGEGIREGESQGLPELFSEIIPKGDKPLIDANRSLKDYLEESKARKAKEKQASQDKKTE